MRPTSIIAITLATAACGSQPAQQPVTNQAQETAQSSQQRILALPEPQRLAVFYRTIHDAGQDCQQVTAAASAGTYRGLPVWRATCRGGGAWTIVIGNSGVAQVLNEAEARLVTDQPAGDASAR